MGSETDKADIVLGCWAAAWEPVQLRALHTINSSAARGLFAAFGRFEPGVARICRLSKSRDGLQRPPPPSSTGGTAAQARCTGLLHRP